MRARSLSAACLAVLLGALLGACNSESPTQSSPPPSNNPTPVQSASISANPDNTFSPNIVELLAGGTVTFSNSGGIHNVSTGDWACAMGCDDQGGNGSPSANGWSFTRTFPNPGTVGFVCDEHSGVGMNGQINVR